MKKFKRGGTVLEYLKGSDKGRRFWTSYTGQEVDSIINDGYHKVIGHYETSEECIAKCNSINMSTSYDGKNFKEVLERIRENPTGELMTQINLAYLKLLGI
jgi:hypothetical protein